MPLTVEGHSDIVVEWPHVLLLFLMGMGVVAASETRIPSIIGLIVPPLDAMRLMWGIIVIPIAMITMNDSWRLPWRRPGVAIMVAFFGCVVAGWLGGVSWPNSGDEYSYVFLADTFKAGRLWDPPPPDPMLFQSFHILVKDGRMFSPYPPAWSAFLVPFRMMGMTWLGTPMLTAGLGIALDRACRRLGVGEAVRKPALALVLLTPFALFMGGSLFPQTMAAALVACMVWVQLADEAGPSVLRKVLIGGLFGVLLLTRYDVFAIVAIVYTADRLVNRRFAAVGDGLLVLAGVIPFAICLGVYDARITGDPFQRTSNWGSPDVIGTFGQDGGLSDFLLQAFHLNLLWLGDLAQFGGLAVLLLAAIALLMKVRRRTSRFYDFMLPAAILFYSLLPFSGDHQYGPRYWFWAWPLCALTIVTGLVDDTGGFRIFRRRFGLESVTAAFLINSAGALCVLLFTTHAYIAARRLPLIGPRPDVRSVVLVPDRQIMMWPWQFLAIPAPALDFTRNDIGFSGPVLYARGDLPDVVARACRLDGRLVFRWEEPGRLVGVDCRSGVMTLQPPCK